MIIIIEGIDRVGKTTLANKLSDIYGIPVLKQERFGGNILNGNESAMMNFGRSMGLVDFWNWENFTDNIIVDRFHWTEAVYSSVDRNNIIPMCNVPNIESMMSKCKDKYLIIYVLPVDINWCNRRHGSDLSKHSKLFDELYYKCSLNKYRCTYYSYDLCINEVGRRLVCNGKTK